jgi:hypothetical protein
MSLLPLEKMPRRRDPLQQTKPILAPKVVGRGGGTMTLGRALLPNALWARWLIVPALAFLATVTDRSPLADFWHHLARGRAIVESGELVNRDLLTFTVADRPFQDVNWLPQVVYYWLFEAGGLALIQVLNSAVIALTFWVVVSLCSRRANNLMAGVCAAAFAFFGVWEVLTIRPQTFSMLLFVVILDLLERSERRPWLLVAPPALVALWTNVHGAFPVGIVLVGCFATAALWQAWKTGGPVFRDRRLLALSACLVACILAVGLNPYGFTVHRFVSITATASYKRQIAEWIRPGPDRLIGVMWLISIGLLGSLMAWRWRRTGWTLGARDVLLLGSFLVLSCGAVRMVPWWILIAAPLLAELLARAIPRLAEAEPDARQPSYGAACMCVVIGVALVFSLPGLADLNPLLGATRRGPRVEDDLEAVQSYLATHYPPGHLYSHFEWGEYLSWSAAPRNRIFMDGRIDIYPDDVWDQYTAVTFAQNNWQNLLDAYDVNYLILDNGWHGKTGLLDAVMQSPKWQPVFQSRAALLFVRKPIAISEGPRDTDVVKDPTDN